MAREERKRFQYHKRTQEQVKKRAEQQGGNRDGILLDKYKSFTPKDKDNILRFLPPTWEGAEHYGYDVYVHYGIGSDNASYLCLSKMKKENCPICEEKKRAELEGDSEYAKSLNPTKRVLVWLIDRTAENEGPKIWSMPWTIDRDISKLSSDKRTGELFYIDDPEEGYDVEFEKTGKNQQTRYEGVQIARRSTSLGNDEWISFIMENPLPNCVNFKDYEYIQNVFSCAGKKEEETESSGEQKEDKEEKQSSKEEPKEEPKEETAASADEKIDLSYDEVQKLERNDLEVLVMEIDKEITPPLIDKMKDVELRDKICKALNLSAPAPAKESYKDKLARLRQERGK